MDANEIPIDLDLNPYFFPTIFAYLNAVVCVREIHLGTMIGPNADAFHLLVDLLQIGMNLSDQ